MEKTMVIKKVIFSVGVAHPLYNKVVDAYIHTECGGYNGRCVYAETVEEVYYPEDPKGIRVYDENNRFLRYKTRPAKSEIWKGYCDCIVI